MKITRDDDFGGALLNCAVRYALGRASYMPNLVMNEIRPMLPDCSDKTLWCFRQDIADWLKGGDWLETDEVEKNPYYLDWKRFLNDVNAERERRED